MSEKELLGYIEEHYSDENDLIARSLINYYELRNLDDKSEAQEECQGMLFDEVLKLFEIMSKQIGSSVDEDSDDIYELLKQLYIKT